MANNASALDLIQGTPLAANTTWTDLATAMVDLFGANVEGPTDQLTSLRFLETTFDQETLKRTCRMLGFDLTQDVLDLHNNLTKIVTQLPLYAEQNGTKLFTKFIELLLNGTVEVTHLYSKINPEDPTYYGEFFPAPGGKLVTEGGDWFETTHINLVLGLLFDTAGLQSIVLLPGQSLYQRITEIFYSLCPIALVINQFFFAERIDAKLYVGGTIDDNQRWNTYQISTPHLYLLEGADSLAFVASQTKSYVEASGAVPATGLVALNNNMTLRLAAPVLSQAAAQLGAALTGQSQTVDNFALVFNACGTTSPTPPSTFTLGWLNIIEANIEGVFTGYFESPTRGDPYIVPYYSVSDSSLGTPDVQPLMNVDGQLFASIELIDHNMLSSDHGLWDTLKWVYTPKQPSTALSAIELSVDILLADIVGWTLDYGTEFLNQVSGAVGMRPYDDGSYSLVVGLKLHVFDESQRPVDFDVWFVQPYQSTGVPASSALCFMDERVAYKVHNFKCRPNGRIFNSL